MGPARHVSRTTRTWARTSALRPMRPETPSGEARNSWPRGSDDQEVGRRLRASLLPLAGVVLWAGISSADGPPRPALAPRFPNADPLHWIGTAATWESLRGRVVLLDVWTFG